MKPGKTGLSGLLIMGIAIHLCNAASGEMVFEEKLSLKGDLRLRHEYRTRKPGSTNDTDMERLRFRLGGKGKVNDQINLGFGFATGSSAAPTSTNQTLENEFDKKDIWLDYAYAEYTPCSYAYLIGGKFESPFLHTDMLWDSDIRFDGFAVKLKNEFTHGPLSKLFLSGGYFPIDDRGTHTDDVYLLAGSGGIKCTCPISGIECKIGITYFSFENLKGITAASLNYENNTNTYVNGALAHDYKVLLPSMRLAYKNIGGLLAEYAQNSEVSTANDAYRLGGWIGSAQAKKPGEFKILTQFSFIQADSFVDVFPDADFSRGGTNGKGWEVIVDYVLLQNTTFSVDFYKTRNISGPLQEEAKVQTDLNFKF
ncbi:MAG: putative porin [bacterium]